MIYSSERNRSSRENGSGKRPGNTILALAATAATLVAIIVFFVAGGRIPSFGNHSGLASEDVEQLWSEQQFDLIISLTEEILVEEPLSAEALVFNGMAHYFHATSNVDSDRSREHLEKAVARLRRALVLEQTPHRREVEYTLGLTYFQRGEYYTDLAVDHLSRALELGFEDAAIHEYLGLAYRDLGNYEESVEHLQAAADLAPRDITYLTIAETFDNSGNGTDAREYLDRVITGSEKPQLVHRARLLMGRLSLEEGQLEEAYRQFSLVLEENPNSADAQYYLGEYYLEQDDRVRARAHWRNALNLDSGHLEALQRLDS